MTRSRFTHRLLPLAAITAALALPAAAQADVVTLSNSNPINFGDGLPNAGSLYPSVISGPVGTVNDIDVSVAEVHSNPDDLDVALVSPAGTAITIFSDACGNDGTAHTLVFDDAAATSPSGNGPCDDSPHRVVNFTPNPDSYQNPGPATVDASPLSIFNGGPSEGAWQLFAVDDSSNNGGAITGWSMTFDFTPPPADGVPSGNTPPGNPTSPINPAGNVRKRKCKKTQKTAGAQIAKKKKCKKKKR